jgi:hypothetical protein
LATPAAADSQAPHDEQGGVLGAWHIAVQVDQPAPASFDALYAFAAGGVAVRVDGRSNTFPASLGSWRNTETGTDFSFVLFSFDGQGKRLGTITIPAKGAIVEGKLIGTFTADGVDTSGRPLPGFPKSGTFAGTRITPSQS